MHAPRHGRRRKPRPTPDRGRAPWTLVSALAGTLLVVGIPVTMLASRGETPPAGNSAVNVAASKPVLVTEAKEISLWSVDTEVSAPVRKDDAKVELGTRFTAAQNGLVSGMRFYKARGERGKHTGSLWSSRGERLAQVTFTDETRSGWQEAEFAAPVRVRAGETYTVSYHSDNGTYVGNAGAPSITSGPLSTPAKRAGVYKYGRSAFPNQANPKNFNYWVDVVFRWKEFSWKTPAPVPPVTESGNPPAPVPSTEPPAVPSPSPSVVESDPVVIPDVGTQTPTPTVTPTVTATPTPTVTATVTATPKPSPTPTPTPSPKPSLTLAPEQPNPQPGTCADHPTPACTGVPAGTKLTKLGNGFYQVKTAGTVLDGVHIQGDLLITANNVTIKNSQIDGGVVGEQDNKFYSFTITDSTVGPASGCITDPGIGDATYTATRVHVRGHSDGFRASGDKIVIKDSYVKLCSSPGDHSDGIQSYVTGKGLVFDHNTVDQRDARHITAPIFLTDPRQVDITLTNNLIMGGTFSIQVKNAKGALIVRNNKLVDRSWVYGPVEADCSLIDWQNNSLVTIDENYKVTRTVGPLDCQL
ncbi:DUF4082 domain-containing protein [Acrocarpospora phusangensis]|nr:DUF4082 domain-containing protein [Acrocarpospora phusangensis]